VKDRLTGSNLAALSRFMDTAMEDGFDGLAEPIELPWEDLAKS
jgi:hypothetical protein